MTRHSSLRALLRGGAAVLALAAAFTVLPAGAAHAVDPERCSGPIAVTPDRLDTMRVCVRWNSGQVTGFIRYYPSAQIGPDRYGEYDFSIQLYTGQGAYGPALFLAIGPPYLAFSFRPSFEVRGNPQVNINGADGGQTYFARGTVAVNQQQSTGITGQSPNVTT